MKVKKALTSLGLVTVLLTGGTCYAENKENPIVAYTEYGYIRLNLPSVKKVDYFGRYFIQCSYSHHLKQYLPYGIPVTTDEGAEYHWFDPLTNRQLYLGNTSGEPNIYNVNIKNLSPLNGGENAQVYGVLQERFPELFDEVRAANQTANEKYGQELDKGLAALAENDPEVVYLHFKKAYDKGCTSSQVLREMSNACWSMGDYDKALEWDGKAIEYSPSSRTYNSRAWHYFLLDKNDQALADVDMALSLDGNNAYALDTRGCIYHELGQYDKAIADFDKAIQIDKNYGHAYYYRNKCYNALGQKEKAAADYIQAKKLNPNVRDDKLNFAIERPKAASYKRARRQIRHDKYQKDLKKLNDAIYVTNNPSNYPAKVVFESNGVVVSVVGYIRENEPEDFYQEVVPQEVRTNFENGTYQQQYEQLQAEIEATKAQAAPAPISLPNQTEALGGTTTSKTFPSTLANVNIHEKYVIPSWDIGPDGHATISYEPSLKTVQIHGKYCLEPVGPGWGYSFDYDSASKTYTIYYFLNDESCKLHCSPDFSTVIAEYSDGRRIDLKSDPGLQEIFAPLITHAISDNDIGQHYKTKTHEWILSLYPQQDYSQLPPMWYKLVLGVDAYCAFTYDKATGIFTMYYPKNINGACVINDNITYKFLDFNHIESHNLKTNETAILVYDDAYKIYANKKSNYAIEPYISAGLRHFYQHYTK